MQKRRLGQTEIWVSPIGLGTVKFGRTHGLKYPHPFELPDDDQLASLLSAAKAYGINLLDTAPAYGESEKRLGRLLKKDRKDWIISTKAGEQFDGTQSSFDFSSKKIIKSIETSLVELNTDYLDIVLIHSDGNDEQIIQHDDVFDTLAQLKQAGKIRAFGMSTKTIAGGFKTVEAADVVMVTYNTECTQDRDVITHAHQLQKGVFVKKALVSGHLTLTAKQHIDFVLEQQGVNSVIVGTINQEHLIGLCGP